MKFNLTFSSALIITFFIFLFSTVMSNWQIFLTGILLCYSIYFNIRVLNNKLAQAYCEGAIDTIKVIEEYERKL